MDNQKHERPRQPYLTGRALLLSLCIIAAAVIAITLNQPEATAAPASPDHDLFLPMTSTERIFTETFSGDPIFPTPWRSVTSDWEISVHSRDVQTWEALEPMQAAHGPNCEPPPATHLVTSYDDAAYQCRNHMMTAINASGYGAIYMTPNQMVDFSDADAVIRFDVSTLRTSGRDWIDLWITPYQENIQLPLQDWLPDLNGEPRSGLHIFMDFSESTRPASSFKARLIRDFTAIDVPQQTSRGYETVLIPSSMQRTTFELRLSKDHIRFGLPDYDLWWIDADIEPLSWSQGVVQWGHHSYNPSKGCSSCGPNTFHWDNLSIQPAQPFTILRGSQRAVGPLTPTTVQFGSPAPANSHLRFSAIGNGLEVSFDGGATWQPAAMQVQEKTVEEHFKSYWMPAPAGTTSIQFRGQAWWGGDWHVRDISIWSPQEPAR